MKKTIKKLTHEFKDQGEIQAQLNSKNNVKHYYRQVKLIKKFIKPIKLLDIGCGHGIPTIFLKNEFKKTTINAIELRKSPVWNRINELYKINFKKFDGKRIPFKNKTFDTIVMFGVLEHVTEDKIITESYFLNEVKRVLKPGGYIFIFNLPNKYSYKEVMAKYTSHWYHERRFKGREIKQILNDKGLVVKYLRGFGLVPGGCGPLRSLLPVLNLFSFITDAEEKLPEFPFCEYFDVVAQKTID